MISANLYTNFKATFILQINVPEKMTTVIEIFFLKLWPFLQCYLWFSSIEDFSSIVQLAYRYDYYR